MTESYPQNIILEEAQTVLQGFVVPTKTENVDLRDALGRVLAEDVVSGENIPPFDRSPYDGYAFNTCDTYGASKENPVFFDVVEEVPAGKIPTIVLTAGKATKILTGSPIPEGADAVIKYEETEYDEKTVKIFTEIKPHSNIIRAGEDITVGMSVAGVGTVISPPLTGLFASMGKVRLSVFKKPVIAVISTGDELLPADAVLEPGKIRNSNLYAIRSYLLQEGAEILCIGIVRDRAQDIADMIRRAMETADMVITTGGVSVGDYDMVHAATGLLDARIMFRGIAIKPGSSLLAADVQGKLLLGLSGNPSAAILGMMQLGLPYIRAMSGRTDVFHEKIKVKLLTPLKKKSPNRRFLRGRLVIVEGEACLESTGEQGNGVLSSLCGCDLLGEIPAGSQPVPAGAMIDAYRL